MFYPPNFEIFNKISQFQNLQKYIIPHQPWPMELSELKKSENKTEINLEKPLNLLWHLQPLQIVTTS